MVNVLKDVRRPLICGSYASLQTPQYSRPNFIRKKNSRTEEFVKEKLEKSILNAGLDQKAAREVASSITAREGITSEEIREAVFKKLKELDEEAANRYARSMRFAARNAADISMEVAQLSEEALENLKLKAGRNVNILNENNKLTLRAEKADIDGNEIRLNKENMEKIGANDGTRIMAQNY
ncbi:MAG: hypothetical protein JRI56_12280 [Deltaproteobacteria bacterium]|nr:hypothetical protein [Deltaproteobacteria bacterium]